MGPGPHLIKKKVRIFISLQATYIPLTFSFVFAKYPQNSFGLYFLFFYAMILSVSQSFRCRAIYASDLLFLRKKSPVVPNPIHQNCLLLLTTLKKPAAQPLHVSTSVENLKFKCVTAAMSTVMKKKEKNITGVYLATRWAVPNLVYQQLNALALTPYPTLNLSPGKACYASLVDSVVPSSWHLHTEVINETDGEIKLSIRQRIGKRDEDSPWHDLEAWGKKPIEKKKIKEYAGMGVRTAVVISAGSEEGGMLPEDFINSKRLAFNIDANGKLVGKKMSYTDRDWQKLALIEQ